jgi:hypothetical protein
MPGSAQSARSDRSRKLHKCLASTHLRGDADQAREGPWRVGARLLKAALALADHTKCNGRQCEVHDLERGRKNWPPVGFARAPTKSCQECPSFRHSTSEWSRWGLLVQSRFNATSTHPKALVITHKSGALRLARLFGKLAYHPEGGMALT